MRKRKQERSLDDDAVGLAKEIMFMFMPCEYGKGHEEGNGEKNVILEIVRRGRMGETWVRLRDCEVGME